MRSRDRDRRVSLPGRPRGRQTASNRTREENHMQAMTAELEQLIGKVIGDLGGAANAALVIVGDRLGLYKALAEIGPASSHELARKTGTHERYIREWLAAQAAS